MVPLLLLCIAVSILLLIPLKVIGYGFLPIDDALRHAAKAVSGKPWNEILVLRPGITMDSHPGWHAILGSLHRSMGWNADRLVVFSVISLFVSFALVPLLFLRRQEAWLLTLLLLAIAKPSFIMRLLKGRPYIFTMTAVLAISFLWPRLREKRTPAGALILLVLLFAASSWIHCSWYLLTLPLAALFLAREWRAGFLMSLCAALGIFLGATFTAHPLAFLTQTLQHGIRSFGNHQLTRMLVSEFQPFLGDPFMAIVICGMLTWRHVRGAWDRKRVDNPVFILVIVSWVLGFLSERFWVDWGIPALAAWMSQEFQDVLDRRIVARSWGRVAFAVILAGTLYMATTADYTSRWTANLTTEFLSLDNPDQAPWLPEPGGIVYSDDMAVFYQTFFKNPNAPWRYILGFEPTMMPPEDLRTFRDIQWNLGAHKAFGPWVKKMRPEDRLILMYGSESPPRIPELEWHYAATGIWIGRLPRQSQKTLLKNAF
jgi:hypothetical protein